MNEEIPIESLSCYCPDCGSCGIWGCCSYNCDKCRTSNNMFDVTLEENEPKSPVGYKHYEDWELMEKEQGYSNE